MLNTKEILSKLEDFKETYEKSAVYTYLSSEYHAGRYNLINDLIKDIKGGRK